MVRGATKTPNQDANGNVISRGPSKALGAWRGRAGYRAIKPIVDNTRFFVRPDADSELLWVAWHIVHYGEPGKPARPPIQCSVCGMRPEKSTLMNLVSTSKSSAECDCSWRPAHGTAEGRAKLAEIAAGLNSELTDSEADWVKLHLRRSERWRVIGVRCLACKRERHVNSGGVLKKGAFTQCICVRKAQRSKSKSNAKAPAAASSSVSASEEKEKEKEEEEEIVLLPSDDEEEAA